MKVVIVSRYPEDPLHPKGGVESVTVVLSRALALKPDVEVHVLCVQRGISSKVIESHDGLTVHRIPGTEWPQLLDITVGPGRQQVLEAIESLSPDVVHWHESWGLACPELPCPQVFTIHGFDSENVVAAGKRFKRLRSFFWGVLERKGIGSHRDIVSITPYVRKKIDSLATGNVHDIYNPLDSRFFSVASDDPSLRVLCVGWINPRKNTLASVQAFGKLVAKGVDARLVLAGAPVDEDYYASVKRAIDDSDLNDRVELLGHVGHVQLEAEMSRATVLLLPSLQENAPMAITEAMAAGVPAIASNRCGMPYMIRDGIDGFLIDPLDIDQIAERLECLLMDPERQSEFGKRARESAVSRYHPDVVSDQTIALYQAMMKTASVGGILVNPRSEK